MIYKSRCYDSFGSPCVHFNSQPVYSCYSKTVVRFCAQYSWWSPQLSKMQRRFQMIGASSSFKPLLGLGIQSECSNHRAISPTPARTNIMASLILQRFIAVRETLSRVLQKRHIYIQTTILMFLDYTGAFNSVYHLVLSNIILLKGYILMLCKFFRKIQQVASGWITNF